MAVRFEYVTLAIEVCLYCSGSRCTSIVIRKIPQIVWAESGPSQKRAGGGHVLGASFSGFPAQPNGGCLRRPHRRRPTATAAAGGPVAAARVFLQEAGQHAGQVFSFRQRAAGLFPGNPTLPVYAGG
jgi:hypothetical protein